MCRGRGGSDSTPMCSRTLLICAPSVMNAIRRIWPPHNRAQQRENLVDSGAQHRPQVMCRCALGRHGLGLGLDSIALRHHFPRRDDST